MYDKIEYDIGYMNNEAAGNLFLLNLFHFYLLSTVLKRAYKTFTEYTVV